jgi:hypothetical protein
MVMTYEPPRYPLGAQWELVVILHCLGTCPVAGPATSGAGDHMHLAKHGHAVRSKQEAACHLQHYIDDITAQQYDCLSRTLGTRTVPQQFAT